MKPLNFDYGILNNVKLDRNRKRGTLIDSKKKGNYSLKIANSWRSRKDLLIQLNRMFAKKVKRLSTYYDIVIPKQIESLHHYLKRISDLESFIISFYGWNQLTESKMAALGQGLKMMKNLKTLDLDMNELRTISDVGFHPVACSISHLTNLRSLTFRADLCSATDKSGVSLARSIGRLTELRNLDLSLERFREVKEKTLPTLAKAIKQLQKLEYFSLNLSWDLNIHEEGMVLLNNSLAELKSLKSYALDSRKCQFGEDTINSLTRLVRSLDLLETFKLEFRGCGTISEQKLLMLFQSFAEKQHLRSLELVFGPNRDISTFCIDQGMQELGRVIQNLENLKVLKFTLAEFTNLEDQSVQILGAAICENNTLEKVELRFEFCQKVTNVAVTELKERMSNHPSIQFAHVSL